MKTFTEPLKELKEFETLSAGVHDLRGIAQISGCIDAAKPHIMYSVNNGSGNRIIVTFQEQRAKEIYEEYRFFDPKAAYYPAKDILFYQSDIRGNVLTAERINALKTHTPSGWTCRHARGAGRAATVPYYRHRG